MKDSGNSYGHISWPHLSYPILHTSFQTYRLAAKTHPLLQALYYNSSSSFCR